MSDDEAEGAKKIEEDAYAAELADSDDDYDGSVKRQKKSSKPAWCLLVKLTFDSKEKVQQLKELFEPYAKWIQENEPGTLSYSLILSDKDPLRDCAAVTRTRERHSLAAAPQSAITDVWTPPRTEVTIFERYEDRLDSYLVKHKQSAQFQKFRPALDALKPVIDGHSYFESGGGFLAR